MVDMAGRNQQSGKGRQRGDAAPAVAAAPRGDRYASFANVYQAARKMEGEQISPKALLDSGEEFIVHRYSTRQSQFTQGEYVSVEIERLNPRERRSDSRERERDSRE